MYANEFGQPNGQYLQVSEGGSAPIQSTSDMDTQPKAGKRKPDLSTASDTLEDRIASLEKKTKVEIITELKDKGTTDTTIGDSFVQIQEWELESGFDPLNVTVREKLAWLTLKSRAPSLTNLSPRAEEVYYDNVLFDIDSLQLRDPDKFVSGQLHNCVSEWRLILDENAHQDVVKWLEDGVDVGEFFRRFKGNFKGRNYDSEIPPRNYFQNAAICNTLRNTLFYIKRIVRENFNWVHQTFGKEPSKPRLCHDERYLNLWVKDLPFHLENLKDVHRLVQENALMITCDEKSGYDHVNLQESSQTYFGIQFGGFYMTYTTLPFGWKASPFIYQSIGICVTSYLRQLDVINTLYIDDRFVVTGGSKNSDDAMLEASKITYMVLQLLTRLGYTLSLSKCSLIPGTCKKFLGFLVDSVKQAYILPDDKKLKFIDLRKSILSMDQVVEDTAKILW
ncbi:unnamed protein product [Mytilus edulis]|uniref:Reverse transcriptase domain-containing protein n=1 Tax=Mytilus edulis TaxID=6550 RepID=A0A8S3R7Y3_MYTED|nr:unnamed protein product [Mytilus edulis]